MGIHDEILNHLQAQLQTDLIDSLPEGDPARAGAIVLGPLQGDPMDPDVARISVELYENDPEVEDYSWVDTPEDDDYGGIEIGGAVTWRRRFSIQARCLLERTREGLTEARQIASTVRSRIEKSLLSTSFAGVRSDGEYVSRGVLGYEIQGKMTQAGGPPDAYDFHILIRFEILTTKTGV